MDDEWFRENDKGYSRPTLRARELRNNPTSAELKLWPYLNAKKLRGVRFNRQFPIGSFICDFVSRGKMMVIELDGGQHAIDVEYDERRTRFLNAQGYKVIRFWNNDVMDNVEGVVFAIGLALDNMPSPNPSRKREGSLWQKQARPHP